MLPTAAIVKTLVMMAGEIEYENFIYENGEALFGVTGHVMIMGSGALLQFKTLNSNGILDNNRPETKII